MKNDLKKKNSCKEWDHRSIRKFDFYSKYSKAQTENALFIHNVLFVTFNFKTLMSLIDSLSQAVVVL
jgi:hypothetical protein